MGSVRRELQILFQLALLYLFIFLFGKFIELIKFKNQVLVWVPSHSDNEADEAVKYPLITTEMVEELSYIT